MVVSGAMLAGLLVAVAPAQFRHPSSVHSQIECADGLPRGMLIDFTRTEELVNNLGGYPKVECQEDAWRLPVVGNERCPCGCGCRCVNDDTPPGVPRVLRYSRVIHIYDGTSTETSEELDLVVTNMTEYIPWKSGENGLSEQGAFLEISILQGMETTFEVRFMKPDTEEKKAVPYGARALEPHSPHAPILRPLPDPHRL